MFILFIVKPETLYLCDLRNNRRYMLAVITVQIGTAFGTLLP
jgi:hypothetical protein